jgi:hypothetical protein
MFDSMRAKKTSWDKTAILPCIRGSTVLITLLVPLYQGEYCIDYCWWPCIRGRTVLLIVVHRASQTSTNQSDVIIRSDDRYTTLSSEQFYSYYVWHELLSSLVGFFSVSILTKILQFYPSWFFFALILSNIWQFCALAYF